MLTPTATDVLEIVTAATAQGYSVFLTRTALELGWDALQLSPVHGFDFFSDLLEVNVYALDMAGAPAVMFFTDAELTWGQIDPEDGFCIGMPDDEIGCKLLGGDMFISFSPEDA